jgi:putative membrane protein
MANDAADAATSLALERTRLAHERTLMAWVRTAVSLITFGFTVYKVFQGLHDARQIETGQRFLSSRGFALVMILLGIGSLVLATVQHRADMQSLARRFSPYGPAPRSTSSIVAIVVALLGTAALMAVLLQQ